MKKTLFDSLDKAPEGVNEETIRPGYEIDPEDVIKGVHEKINENNMKGGNTKMKRSHKKAIVVIAAALTAALALGTLTVGALGGVNSIIGDHSAGEMENNLYPGGDVNAKTSSSYKADFAGIAGDDTNMVSLLRISSADGSDIIETGKNAFIESHDYRNYYDKTSKQIESDVVNIDPDKEIDIKNLPTHKEKVWQTAGAEISDTTGDEFDKDAAAAVSHSIWFRDPFDSPYPCSVEYEMSGSKTINCYLTSHIDGGLFRSLKGETLKASDETIFVYQIDKVLYNAASEEEYARFSLDTHKLNSLITDNISSLRDDQVITAYGYSLVVATRKELKIDMELSVRLNYKSNTKQLPSKGDTLKGGNGTDFTISSIAVGSLSTDLGVDFKVPEGADEYKVFSGLITPCSDIKINLTNGKTISAEYSINRNYEEHHTITLTYCEKNDNGINNWVIVAPEEIGSIEINGRVINK